MTISNDRARELHIEKAKTGRWRLSDATLLNAGSLGRLLATLDSEGESARVVGGAVRNLVLGLPISDVDIGTTAEPEAVVRRAQAAGFRAVPTGAAHGTITIILDGTPFEVTTLREDIETDGRRAKVRFGRSFEADALRRDFTINAMSVDREGVIYDYAGGLDDLIRGRVRFVGDPYRRIAEDYLRVLRFFRFNAAYGEGDLDPAGLAAAIALRDGLRKLSRERVRSELLKLLVARRAAEVTAALCASGLFTILTGGIGMPGRLGRVAAIEGARGEEPDAILHLAALSVWTVEDADRLREKLRLSNEEGLRLAQAARALVSLHGLEAPPKPAALQKLLFHKGRAAARDAITLAHAASESDACDTGWVSAYRFVSDAPEPQLPITGTDVLARGVHAGRAVGETLKTFQANWIRAGFPRDPMILARLLDEAIALQGDRT